MSSINHIIEVVLTTTGGSKNPAMFKSWFVIRALQGQMVAIAGLDRNLHCRTKKNMIISARKNSLNAPNLSVLMLIVCSNKEEECAGVLCLGIPKTVLLTICMITGNEISVERFFLTFTCTQKICVFFSSREEVLKQKFCSFLRIFLFVLTCRFSLPRVFFYRGGGALSK